MREIKFNPVCGKKSEILYAKPCVLTFREKYIMFRCEFGYSHSLDDEMMPSKEVSVDDMSVFLKHSISCVEWAYSSSEEVWFFQLWHNGENSYWNVESKAVAVGIVDELKDWLLS